MAISRILPFFRKSFWYSLLLFVFVSVILNSVADRTEESSRTKKQVSKNSDTTSSFPLYGESYDDLPLPEKIKTIISQNGPISFFQIAALLRHERYGKVKMSPFRLFFLLKELNLETKWKRIRFYRSCWKVVTTQYGIFFCYFL